MKYDKEGISLIILIITILVITVIAAVIIPSGIDKINNAKLAAFNEDILTLNEEVSGYFMLNNKYPVKIDGDGDPIVYTILDKPGLLMEATKKDDQNDTFYILDLDKLKIDNKEKGMGKTIDDYYIIAKKSLNVYYIKGLKIGNMVYYTKHNKGDGVVAVIPTSAATPTATSTPVPGATNTPTPTSTPVPGATNTPTPTPSSTYSYSNPIVPEGFQHVGTETWDNGFTIEDSYGNRFVWVPALSVQPNGTLDNINFNSKFGRRNFEGEIFDSDNYNELNDTNFESITAGVNKYGGFYIGKYEMSYDSSVRKYEIKAGVFPLSVETQNIAQTAAERMDTDWGWNTNVVESYLCYGAHWDTTLEWIIDSGAKTSSDVISDSSNWGNYSNDTFSGTTDLGITGQWSETCVKGIYDLAGNLQEWTMEGYGASNRVYRPGSYLDYMVPPASRLMEDPNNYTLDGTFGARVVLHIK